VLDGGSLYARGIAGTGKTHYIQTIVEQLRGQGKRVEIISKTHTASRRAGGKTADHWVRKHVLNGCCTADVIWVDEISQLDVGLLAQLNKLTYTSSVRWLLSGDFHQFPPVHDAWKGAPVQEGAFENSALLHRMAGGAVVTLTECKRSEAQLYAFYSSLIPGGSRHELPLADCLKAAKEQFHYEGPCRWNLVISHKKRKKLNKELNLHNKPPEGAVWLEVKAKSTGANAAQSMFLWPGLQLFGCLAGEKKGVRNQCLYTVKEVGEDIVRFEELESTFTHEQAKQWFRLSYAQTYASCQGTEFDGPLRLWDTANVHFTKRHLFVALSRAKQAAFVSVKP
jgi:hypothetical protein